VAVLKRSIEAELPKSRKGFARGNPDELAARLHNICSCLWNAMQVVSYLILLNAAWQKEHCWEYFVV